MGASTADGITPVALEANPSTGALLVETTSSGSNLVEITDGTNTGNVANTTGANPLSGNSLLTAPTGYTTSTVTLTSASPASPWFDLINYPSLSLEILSNSSGSNLAFMTSGDASQTNAVSTSLLSSSSTDNQAVVSTSSATATYYGNRTGRYFRVNGTLTGGNTITLALTFYTNATAVNSMGVSAAQFGTWTVTANLAASTTGGYSYNHIVAGQATTTVKSGAGTLHAIVYNSAAAATNVTTVYDSTTGSGNVIAVPAATAVTAPMTVLYDLAFTTGLTIVTGTANGSDMTVVYK